MGTRLQRAQVAPTTPPARLGKRAARANRSAARLASMCWPWAATLREWVASEIPSKEGSGARALLRGAAASAAGPEHRCAARHALDSESKAVDLGFRCCKGAPNAAIVPEPKLGDTFSRGKISSEALEKVFKRDPHTANIAAREVLPRAGRGQHGRSPRPRRQEGLLVHGRAVALATDGGRRISARFRQIGRNGRVRGRAARARATTSTRWLPASS